MKAELEHAGCLGCYIRNTEIVHSGNICGDGRKSPKPLYFVVDGKSCPFTEMFTPTESKEQFLQNQSQESVTLG